MTARTLKDGWAKMACDCVYKRDGIGDVMNFVYCQQHSDNAARAESHAELIVALCNYADYDQCVCDKPGNTSGECCACIAQAALDRARGLVPTDD